MTTVNNAVNVVSPIGQSGSQIYAADSGTTNTFVVTLSPVPAALTAGLVVNFLATNTVSGTSTLNVNGLGAKTIKKFFTANLVSGDINAGQLVTVVYDGTNFQMQSQTASGGGTGSVTSVATAGLATGGPITTTGTITVTAATQTEQVTPTSTVIAVVPAVQQYHPSAAKAWCKADSAGNVAAQYNCSTVTDGGVGLITFNWDTAFTTTSYSAVPSVYITAVNTTGLRITTFTAGSIGLTNTDSSLTLADPINWQIVAYGTLV